jgi:hypothetical protein
MRMELESARKSEAALRSKLEQFEKSTPSFGGDSQNSGAPQAGGSRMSSLMQRLQQIAK